jgi:predicted nucleic acid-binding Zn ribbon protein
MTYSYHCKECDTTWDESHGYENREGPVSLPCPHCGANSTVKRVYTGAAGISYEGAKTVAQRAGWGWNDVLTKIKKSSGRNSKIQTR